MDISTGLIFFLRKADKGAWDLAVLEAMFSIALEVDFWFLVVYAIQEYNCKNIEFDGPLPRIDNIQRICQLQINVQQDYLLSMVMIDKIVCYAIVSLFYSELNSMLEWHNGEFISIYFIFYMLRKSNPSFEPVLNYLLNAALYLDRCPMTGKTSNNSLISKDGNFWKQVKLSINGRFKICLKQGDSGLY